MNINSNFKGDLGENFVNEIAYKSFLKYWCYPNPKFENGNKKEICDLLIIFKEVCVIISVKNYEFKGNHVRYFNNTIEKAIKQVEGAYKTLFKKGKVKIKHPDKNLEEFPKDKITRVFKIILNLGEGVEFYDITRTINDNNFITIFDKNTFEIIAHELNTIPDFIDYLEKREELFKNKSVQVITSEFPKNINEVDKSLLTTNLQNSIKIIGTEKDLLSYFFKNTRSFPESISKERDNFILLDIAGAWEEFKISPNAIKKEFADTSSYFVDKFVSNEVLNSNYPLKEEIAKELLSLNRLQRRAVGIGFFEFYEKVQHYSEGMIHRRFMEHGNLAIVFFNFFDNWGVETIQKLFDLIFETFAYHYGYKHETFIIIGLNKTAQFAFHIEKEYEKFDLEDEKIIKSNIDALGWFTDYNEQKRNINEFPK